MLKAKNMRKECVRFVSFHTPLMLEKYVLLKRIN